MSVFERMADVRHRRSGKALSVVLAVSLSLSFLNVAGLPSRAFAEDANGEAPILPVSDRAADDPEAAPVPSGDAAADPSPEDPAADDAPGDEGAASGTDGDAADEVPTNPVEDDAADSAPAGESAPADDEPVLPADEADGSGEEAEGSLPDSSALAAASLSAEANDGTRVTVTASAGFPAGAQLRVETALSQEVTEALRAALPAGKQLGAHTAYKIEVLDAAGEPAGALGDLTVSMDNPPVGPLGVEVFRLVGNGHAQQVQGALQLVPDYAGLSFVTPAASSVYALAVIEDAPAAGEPGQPDDGSEGEGGAPQDPPAPLPGDTPSEEGGSDDGAARVESLELYVGEARAVSCIAGHNHSWVTDDAAVASLANTSSPTVTIRAVSPGTTTVRCDDQALFAVTVKEAPASEVVTHFYFLPPTADGMPGSTENAKYLGSGLVRVPAGYESHRPLVNGSVIASSADAAGNPIANKVVNLREMIVEAPSDKEIRTGLAAYYRGTLDGAQDGQTSRLKYDDSWTYTYEPVLFEGEKTSVGYNGSAIEPSSAYHMYVSLNVTTPDSYTVSYTVSTPTGTETRSVMHQEGDEPIALAGLTEGASSVTVDGIQYHASKTVEGGTRYLFDGWYADAAFRTRAAAVYDEGVSATFYARYVAENAPTATFDAAGGTFADGTTAPQALRVSEGGSYWLPEAPERFGYTFAGWKMEGSDALHAAGVGRTMGSADVRYVAAWTPGAASIVFDAGDGSLEEGASAELTGITGAALSDRSLPTPVLPGYRFVGWYTSEGLTGSALLQLPSVFPAGRTTYYAKYEEDPSQRYTVSYLIDPGNRAAGHLEQGLTVGATGASLADRNLLMGTSDGVRGAVVRPNPGYRFKGWFKMSSRDAGVMEDQVTDALTLELTPAVAAAHLNGNAAEGFADTTFVACFDFVGPFGASHEYRIEYFLMGDDGAYADTATCVRELSGNDYLPVQASAQDKAFDLAGLRGVPADYAVENYVPDDDAPGAVYEGILEPGRDVALKVYLKKRLAVAFDAGAHGAIDVASVAEDAVLSEDGAVATYRRLLGEAGPAAPAVVPAAGYRFDGWSAGDAADADPTAPVRRAVTYSARYTALPATMTFVENGGAAVEALEGVTGEPLGSTDLPATEREGYAFAGWYDNEACEGDALAALPATMPAGETVYYAKWEAMPARIIFDKNAADATGSAPVGLHGVTDGAVTVAFPTTVNLEREGYVFAGWNSAADGSGEAVEGFPATFPAGETVYYAQWRLDVSGLEAADFSYEGVYDGRDHRLGLPAGFSLKEGERFAMLVGETWVTDPEQLPRYRHVADGAEDLTVGILSRDGEVLFRADGVLARITPAALHVATGSVVQPYNGAPAVSEQIAVTGLVNGETVGARATGAATEVGEEVPNTFELTWAGAGNDYTAQEGDYAVTADLGVIRMVSAECPVSIEGFAGVYDGVEHAVTWESPEAEVVFDAPLAYTEAGRYEIGYTVSCPDHGTFAGTVAVNILARPVTIQVEDSFKIAGTVDPLFRGSIVEGELVDEDDLGTISFERSIEGEDVGLYAAALTARFEPNANYAVAVLPGTFTIGPAGSTVVPSQNPLLPPRGTAGPGPSGDAAVPGGATSAMTSAVTAAVSAVVGGMSAPSGAAVTRASDAGAAMGYVARAAEVLLDEETPLAATAMGDDEVPTITRVGGEVIEDDATALGAFDEPHCWVHWLMVLGLLLTVLFAVVALGRRSGHTRRLEAAEAEVLAPGCSSPQSQAPRAVRRTL